MDQHLPAGFLTDVCCRNLAPEARTASAPGSVLACKARYDTYTSHMPAATLIHIPFFPFPLMPGPFWVTLGNNGGPSYW